MNCKEFEDIVYDLAGAKMIDAASRDAGLAHAETCERCASRLADERSLSAGLKSLLLSDEEKSAPDSVESALLEAFRAQSPDRIARRAQVQAGLWPRKALAAAAAVLIASGLVVYRAIQYRAIQNAPQKDNQAVTEKTLAPQPLSNRASNKALNSEVQVVKKNGAAETRKGSRAPKSRLDNRRLPNAPFIRDSVNANVKDSEYTNEFFLLSNSDDQKPMESGEVIRVQVPRSALIALGLPVNIERADVPVLADLLIGEDGLARAIRFLR